MKRISKKVSLVVAGVFFIACSMGVNAQDAKQDSGKVKNAKVPEIEFESLVHDYGTIFEGDDGSCVFVFKNTGKEPLVLSNVQSSCGCTVPTWPKEPIMPGKKAEIKVVYNTHRVGGINKTVTVYSNAASNPSIVLRITGTVQAKPQQTAPENPETPVQNK
ncbi:MAG: DUF1573 domain-containing protein [Bacteroidales bacterium]|jgi:hypothetical protein|nr:DUF1573 domain-containing protein [Bacteroidales bacterium]